MKWTKGILIAVVCVVAAILPASAAGTLQWGTCSAPLGVITDETASSQPVLVGSRVELWDTITQHLIATAAIGDGIILNPAGKFVANESLPEGGYALQVRVFNVSDPYTGDMTSCAVVVGANGRGTAGIPLNLSTTPASICFPSAVIPDQAYVPGVGGCRIFSPLGVTLASFDAINTANGVLLRWETTTEIQNRGFNLYRSESEAGPWAQLNAFLIPSQSTGSPSGFVYEYLDGDVTVGATYYYLLEDVSISGQTTQHGPVIITYFGVPTAVKLVVLDAQSLAPDRLWMVLLAAAAGLAAAAILRRRRVL